MSEEGLVMSDKEFAEMVARHNWSAGQPIPRGMLLEILLPGLVALFGLEYAPKEEAQQEQK
jgi:hypothetical protein